MSTTTDRSTDLGDAVQRAELRPIARSEAEGCVQIYRRGCPSWKRLLDVCLVIILAPLMAPILVAVAVYIRIVSPGPVLFTQSRIGHGGQPFTIYKFRTMRVSEVSRDAAHRGLVAGYAGGDSAMRKPDHRGELIFGGDFLRRSSIDELPQLLNVLKGNMTLVGPRPDVLQLEDYQPAQLRRFEVLPGMTGLWQVSGKNRLSFEQMVELDIEYIDTLCFARDLIILAKTAVVLVVDRNQ